MRMRLFVLVMILSPLSQASSSLEYSFENGTQGWTSVLESTDPAMAFDRQAASSLLRLSSYGISVSDGDSPHRDSVQNCGLLFRSPEFRFDSLGDASISFQLGSGSQFDTTAPSFDSDSSLSGPSSETGYAGLLLRNVSSGAYVIASQRETTPNSAAETITWSTSDLSGLINDQDRYTLDLIDLKDGPWGWVSLDNVSVSGALAVSGLVFFDNFESGNTSEWSSTAPPLLPGMRN